ncbi:MAG: class I SAM-dependent methyltransferase [Rikenellaceae bacterium]
MSNMLIDKAFDPMGHAIADHFNNKETDKLRLFSSQFEEDELPINELFRSYQNMPMLEQIALQKSNGKILDVGAGSGCHALALQEQGKEVCAIDISPLSVETMKKRGVLDVRLINMYDSGLDEKFDTILMLMNGSGIIGSIDNIGTFLERMKQILAPNGQILLDSSDLRYLFEEEDGSFLIDISGDYYGEIDFQMQYKDIKGKPFNWLYIDFDTLDMYCNEYGFKAEIVAKGSHYDYLASITIHN